MSLLLLLYGIQTPDADQPIPPVTPPGPTLLWGGGSGGGVYRAGRKRLPFPIFVIEPKEEDDEDDDIAFMMMS